jgi:hypothetical protein
MHGNVQLSNILRVRRRSHTLLRKQCRMAAIADSSSPHVAVALRAGAETFQSLYIRFAINFHFFLARARCRKSLS